MQDNLRSYQFQHTAARRRLEAVAKSRLCACAFQHTAARRRLALLVQDLQRGETVSTHSRPKAAGIRIW